MEEVKKTAKSSKKTYKRRMLSKKTHSIKERAMPIDPLGYRDQLEEDRLEKLVLGQESKLLEALSESETEQSDAIQEEHKLTPAWVDDEVCDKTASRTKKFEEIVGNPKWAKLDRKRRNSSSDEDDDNALLRHCGNLITSDKGTTLRSGTIELKRNLDLNRETYTEGPIIRAIEFHQTATVALVAGVSGIATLFQVDGRTNVKLQSIQFSQFPISCAKFSVNSSEFLVGSPNHKHFFCYDMEAGESIKVNPGFELTNFKKFELSPDGQLMAVIGRFGDIHLLTARTKEVIGTLKMNSEVTAIAFDPTGSQLYSHGDSGEIYVWDTHSRTCVERFIDDGCIAGLSLAVGKQYVAAGSNTGVVNIYPAKKRGVNAPLKTILHLRTPASCIRLNPSEEILAISSSYAKNAIKLVHLPSFTVFSNFPGRIENLWRPECISFSPNSGYLAVGNHKGTALLYRLKHYGNY